VSEATPRRARIRYIRAVILRVTRNRVIPGHEEHVLNILRELTAGMGASIKGLHSATFGRAMGDKDQGMSLISITEWDSLEAVVEHFESTLEDVTAIVEQRRRAGT
jgi:heme-degrading monooxygenase HmoA